jgi:hypothetical protein
MSKKRKIYLIKQRIKEKNRNGTQIGTEKPLLQPGRRQFLYVVV